MRWAAFSNPQPPVCLHSQSPFLQPRDFFFFSSRILALFYVNFSVDKSDTDLFTCVSSTLAVREERVLQSPDATDNIIRKTGRISSITCTCLILTGQEGTQYFWRAAGIVSELEASKTNSLNADVKRHKATRLFYHLGGQI